MKKNITVIDNTGNIIGTTYPKRASGLIKHGRAEPISGCTIRLLTAHAPPHPNIDTEAFIMSKIINFNCREFRIDENVKNSAGSRMVLSDPAGGNSEAYELGDWSSRWSQIICDKCLESNTDYVFRFAMTGGFNDVRNEVSRFVLFPKNRWDDRMTYPLEKSRFKPVLSKRAGDNLLRVYEIPFNTENYLDWSFLFISQYAVATFFPAKDNESYAHMSDLTYDQWWEERMESPDFQGVRRKPKPAPKPRSNDNGFPFDFKGFPFNVGDMKIPHGTKPDIGIDMEQLKNGAETLKKGMETTFNQFKDMAAEFMGNSGELKLCHENISEAQFAASLCSVDDGGRVTLENVRIESDGSYYDSGKSVDGSRFDVKNTTMRESALLCLFVKMGDGCSADIINTNISEAGNMPMSISPRMADGCCISVENTTMTSKALSIILSFMGDGCVLNLTNCTFTGNDNILYGSAPGDGICVNLRNTLMPDSLREVIRNKFGDGCSLSEI